MKMTVSTNVVSKYRQEYCAVCAILVCVIIVHSCSVDPPKLCVGVKYYIVHMYSMPYYTYGSTTNFFCLRAYSTFIYIKRTAL